MSEDMVWKLRQSEWSKREFEYKKMIEELATENYQLKKKVAELEAEVEDWKTSYEEIVDTMVSPVDS